MGNSNKIEINLTRSGLVNSVIAVTCGFLIKTGYDYFCAKDLVLNLSKSAALISSEHIVDSISFANQVGRLDMVSLVLALLGIVLGFGAVAGFLHIKENAENIAREETKKWLDENSEKIIKKIIMEKEAYSFKGLDPEFVKNAKKEAKKANKKPEDYKYED